MKKFNYFFLTILIITFTGEEENIKQKIFIQIKNVKKKIYPMFRQAFLLSQYSFICVKYFKCSDT